MLSKKKSTEPLDQGAKSDPFEEDDVGKRFQLLKAQMNVQENDSQEAINQSALSNITDVQPGDPAGPVSGSIQQLKSKTRDLTVAYQPKAKVKGRLTPTKGGRANQINMTKSIDAEPATVSYNTKVFNREIMALKNEEEALLKYQNAARKREYKVDQLKYKPSMVDYKSLSAQKQSDSAATLEARRSSNSIKVSKMGLKSNQKVPSMYSLEVNLDPEKIMSRRKSKQQSMRGEGDLGDVLDYQNERLGSDSGSDHRSHMKS